MLILKEFLDAAHAESLQILEKELAEKEAQKKSLRNFLDTYVTEVEEQGTSLASPGFYEFSFKPNPERPQDLSEQSWNLPQVRVQYSHSDKHRLYLFFVLEGPFKKGLSPAQAYTQMSEELLRDSFFGMDHPIVQEVLKAFRGKIVRFFLEEKELQRSILREAQQEAEEIRAEIRELEERYGL